MLEGLGEIDDAAIGMHNGLLGRYPRLQLATLEHIQKQQCVLAGIMLSSAKDDIARLHQVRSCAKEHIHSSQQLFRLADNVFRIAVPADGGPRSDNLLQTSFRIGLHVMSKTRDAAIHWRRKNMISWTVNCAIEVGLEGLRRIMIHWGTYFTPTEATTHVAVPIMQHQTFMRLGLNFSQQEELSNYARTLALECMSKDPPACSYTALTLCENEQFAFEQAYRNVTIFGAQGIMTPAQLFHIARYMEVRGLPDHAYKIALLAVKLVQVLPNGDNHQHITDINWTCSVALLLGKGEMAELIPILVRNIQCAPVLADILKRCMGVTSGLSSIVTPVAPGMPPPSAPTVLPTTSTASSHHHPASHHHHQHHHHGSSHHHHSFHESSSSSSSSHKRSRCHPKHLPVDKPPLRLLLEATISAYINTTNSRLAHISPRHYGDFIEFLTKAQDTFKMSPDGSLQFAALLENMKNTYKGKKKLMFLVKERFG